MGKAYVVYYLQVAYSAVPAHRRRRASTLCLTLIQDMDNSDHAAQHNRPNVNWVYVSEIKCETLRPAEHHPTHSQGYMNHALHTHRKYLDTVDAISEMALTFFLEYYTVLDS